jgi:thiamine biosynthesis lipoprotein
MVTVTSAPAAAPAAYRRLRFIVVFPILLCVLFSVASDPVSHGSVARAGAPTPDALTRFTYTQYHMGVDARLVVYAKDQQTAEEACAAAFARVAELDSIMSDYRVNSELNKLGAASGGPAARVSPELFTVLRRAQEVSRRSDGAFDVTAGPLIRLWRKARRDRVLPSRAEIARARRLVGWQKLRLDARARTVRLTTPGMQLDLGGIAKGYAADEAQRVLKRHGITRALAQLGGDIVVSGPPPDAAGWKVRSPNAGDDQGPVDLIVSNRAVSTSGDTEQFAVIGGKRYSHVVDPRTGRALTHRVQVTVLAPDGFTSDPLSTALSILSPSARQRLLRPYPGVQSYVRVLKEL